ncbi:hypothetical protein POM88_015474 [Heracleum sosnowskyi]|uniref:Uncharacterized protein n=1 Tax=Heracleum sosnowskyi TaxID=360622 RepID=A0AAD8IM10_9APIA|nr:hypothetical protein POM88_015474 [Heracleum sosnowskyi]
MSSDVVDDKDAEACASIIEHIRDNIRKILSEEKTRDDKNIQKNGGDYVNHMRGYLKPKVWEKFCEYWKSDDFQRRSAFAKAARGHVRTPHTSCSITFERRRREYKHKHGEEQDIIEHFKDTYTLRKKKQSDQISKAAIDAIIGKAHLEDDGVDHNVGDRDSDDNDGGDGDGGSRRSDVALRIMG